MRLPSPNTWTNGIGRKTQEARTTIARKNPYPSWLESLVRHGHLTHAEYEGQRSPLNIDALDSEGIMAQMTAQAREAFGLARTADNEYSGLLFCFEPEGWTLTEHMGCSANTLPLLLDQLSPHEKAAWMAFADDYVREREGEPMKALLHASHLDQALPTHPGSPNDPVTPGKRRGLPRL